MRRRRLLAGAGVGLAATLAGCGSLSGVGGRGARGGSLPPYARSLPADGTTGLLYLDVGKLVDRGVFDGSDTETATPAQTPTPDEASSDPASALVAAPVSAGLLAALLGLGFGLQGYGDAGSRLVAPLYPDRTDVEDEVGLRGLTFVAGVVVATGAFDTAAFDDALPDAWEARIDDLVAVYRSYVSAYDQASRERGVVSHVDCAHWVRRYFGDMACPHRWADDAVSHSVVAQRRCRLRDRWQSRIDLLVIDEAQDISTAQHDALARLVTDDTRVVLYGDPFQSIYTWRNARPSSFADAITDGVYFGREWDTHVAETAQTTYRQRPALTDTVDVRTVDRHLCGQRVTALRATTWETAPTLADSPAPSTG